jgi:hypothetical protein
VDVALTIDPARQIGLFRYVAIGERLEDILIQLELPPLRKACGAAVG